MAAPGHLANCQIDSRYRDENGKPPAIYATIATHNSRTAHVRWRISHWQVAARPPTTATALPTAAAAATATAADAQRASSKAKTTQRRLNMAALPVRALGH